MSISYRSRIFSSARCRTSLVLEREHPLHIHNSIVSSLYSSDTAPQTLFLSSTTDPGVFKGRLCYLEEGSSFSIYKFSYLPTPDSLSGDLFLRRCYSMRCFNSLIPRGLVLVAISPCFLHRCLIMTILAIHTVIRFVLISAKFGICTVIGLNGTLVETKIRRVKPPKCFSVFYVASTRVPLTLQRQNAENLKQIFPEKEYRGLSPNFHIHVSVSKLYIPTMCLPVLLILGIYKSLKDTWMWKLGLRPRYSQKRNI